MPTAKKYPEFELPPVILEAIKAYLGPARMAKLTASQRGEVAALVQETAEGLGRIIDPPSPTGRGEERPG